ncbi:MAG: hypothetical protein QOK26_2909, partial [Pseudonocardiales bacterium]|nr:hypothetical protein [Pseudonocardiales bacterium]
MTKARSGRSRRNGRNGTASRSPLGAVGRRAYPVAMTGAELDWAVSRPHPALRALVSRYIGYRQDGVLLEVH